VSSLCESRELRFQLTFCPSMNHWTRQKYLHRWAKQDRHTPTGITFSVDSEDDNFGIKRLSFVATGFVRSSDDSEDKYFGMKRFLFFETGFLGSLENPENLGSSYQVCNF
jgi:hypothetical protein